MVEIARKDVHLNVLCVQCGFKRILIRKKYSRTNFLSRIRRTSTENPIISNKVHIKEKRVKSLPSFNQFTIKLKFCNSMAQTTDMTTNEKTAEHHVHFDQKTLKEEDFEAESSCVTYQQIGKNIVDVHLGFLQHNYRYLIELHLPADLFNCKPNVPINLVADNNIAPNVHCKLADRVTELISDTKTVDQAKEKFFVIKVEYFAHKEKLLREELKLVNANNLEELLKLFVSARVLGKGKGTPMLRNGIHCLGYEATESDGESSSKSDHNQPKLVSLSTDATE